MKAGETYGFWPGRYPAIVRGYDAGARMCRVEIPGLTDGGDVLPLAEIEYSLGDKSRAGANSTEIEITAGDPVWVAFIGGDARYPIITGYRNPQAGNSTGWRRWHHANMELLADALMNLIAQGDVLIKSGSHVTVQAPSATVQADDTHVTGNLTVDGAIVGKGGLAVSGGSGVSVEGNIGVQGNIDASGTIMDGGGNSNHHSH
ncbi:hypothetical protein [Pandoraea apista]|uniref:hypothetical protein n=1 Tax=Pandoraea apista TaxID=93218 RepID=UPI001EE590DA|nr:hypothetical protein [Pandoraea apista]